jgi:integrase
VAPDTFPSKADAYAWLDTVSADVQRGAWVDPRAGQITLRKYAGAWLASRNDLSVRTRELYQHLLDAHVLPGKLGDSRLAKLTPSEVRAWHSALASSIPSTAAKAYRLLSTIMRTAVTDSIIVRSPCRVEGAGVEKAPERPIATLGEIQALTEAMPEHLRVLVMLAAWCQLRRAELLGLRRGDIDPMHGTVAIERSRTFTMKGVELNKAPKSDAGRRTLSIPRHLLPDVEAHLERFVAPGAAAPVFVGVKGAPLSPQVLNAAWSKARASIGRPDLHLHDLRHSGLTLAAAQGATVAELMHRAGHASPAAALRYQHATADRDRIIADALADLAQPAPVRPIEGRDSV